MKKGLSLLIVCMMSVLMMTSVVHATSTVTSGDGVSVSGGDTVSGNDIPTQGNISDYLFRYEDESDGYIIVTNIGMKYLIFTSESDLSSATEFQLAPTFNIDYKQYPETESGMHPIFNTVMPRTADGVQGVIANQELWGMTIPINSELNSISKITVPPTKVSGALFVAEAGETQYRFIGFYNKSDLPIYSPDMMGKTINVSVDTLSKSDSEVKFRVNFSSDSSYRKFDPNGSLGKNIRILDSDGKKVQVKTTSGYEGSADFVLKKNGRYTIEVNTYSGQTTVEYTVSGISKESDHNSGDEDDSLNEEIKIDRTAPSISFSALPTSAYKGSPLSITIYTDEPAKISMNGKTSQGYVTEFVVTVSGNGTYTCIASDEQGNSSTSKLDVDIFTETNVFDEASRDNAWGDTVNQKLPQTGTIGLLGVALLCGCGAGVGVYCIKKSRKNGGKSDEDE